MKNTISAKAEQLRYTVKICGGLLSPLVIVFCSAFAVLSGENNGKTLCWHTRKHIAKMLSRYIPTMETHWAFFRPSIWWYMYVYVCFFLGEKYKKCVECVSNVTHQRLTAFFRVLQCVECVSGFTHQRLTAFFLPIFWKKPVSNYENYPISEL